MATTSSNELTRNLDQLVAEFVRSAQQMVLAAVAQGLRTEPSTTVPTSATKPRKGTKPRKCTKPRKRAKSYTRRTPAQVAELGERFYEVLCAHPGETMAVLAAKIGSTPRELQRPVTLLKRAGRVRSVGQRQATRYFPMVGGAEAA